MKEFRLQLIWLLSTWTLRDGQATVEGFSIALATEQGPGPETDRRLCTPYAQKSQDLRLDGYDLAMGLRLKLAIGSHDVASAAQGFGFTLIQEEVPGLHP